MIGDDVRVWADRKDGEWQEVTFTGEFDAEGTQAHRVGIEFTNNASGRKAHQDRNLFVDSVEFNGVVNGTDEAFGVNATKYWDFSL